MVTSRKGVTLMELIVVLGIISVLFAIAAPMLQQVNRQFIMVRTKLELQREGRALMYTLTRELRQAHSAGIVLDRVNSSQPLYSRITFVKEQGSDNVTASTMTFQQEGTVLYQCMGGISTNKRVLTRNLNYLAFAFPRVDDMSIISVSMTLRKNIYEGRTKALHMTSEKVRVMN